MWAHGTRAWCRIAPRSLPGSRRAPIIRLAMSREPRPEDLLDRPLPDLRLPDQHGESFALRSFVGQKPLALFCYILNGSPG